MNFMQLNIRILIKDQHQKKKTKSTDNALELHILHYSLNGLRKIVYFYVSK